MPKKATAPRRKPKDDAVPRDQRGTKLTCSMRVCNAEKWAPLEALFSRVCALKNRMSAYVQANSLSCILNAYDLKARYKDFPSTDLNAWERQALFQDIVGAYQLSLSQRFNGNPVRLQAGWTYDKYQRAGSRTLPSGTRVDLFKKGDMKPGTFRLRYAHTPLVALANYLMRADTAAFDPAKMAEDHPLRADFLRVQQDATKWSRLLQMVVRRQTRLTRSQKVVHYVTGTFRVNPGQSRTSVVIDASNKEHKLWLKLRLGLGKDAQEIYLPLQSNKGRLRHIAEGDVAKLGFAKEFRLKFANGRKLHVCTTYDAIVPEFLPEDRTQAMDLNTKHSFMTDSEGRVYHLSQLLLEQGLALLAKIDAAGGVSKMGYRQAAQLRQWLRRNEASVKKHLAQWCDDWLKEGITDLWVEDLAMSQDTTFIRHPVLGQKYSRVLRLMRLSGVKDWLLSIAEKRGMRLHTTQAAYSSQECPACHHVSRGNRPRQELFDCEVCGCMGDADQVAALNLKNRSGPAMRDRLHETDAFGRCSPKSVNRSVLKSLLMAQRAGGVPELLTPAIQTKWTPAQAAVLQEAPSKLRAA